MPSRDRLQTAGCHGSSLGQGPGAGTAACLQGLRPGQASVLTPAGSPPSSGLWSTPSLHKRKLELRWLPRKTLREERRRGSDEETKATLLTLRKHAPGPAARPREARACPVSVRE